MAISLGNVTKSISSFGGALSNFGAASQYEGAAAGDLLSAQGYDEEAKFYGQAGALTETSRQIQKASTDVQVAQQFRSVFKTIDTQRAGYSAGGLAISGSALDVMRASAMQGEVERRVIQTQGGLKDIELEQEGISYQALGAKATAAAAQARETAEANRRAASSSSAGGFLGIVGGILGLFCWLAREVYGADDPRWMDFRRWMLAKSPEWLLKLYVRYGFRAACFVADKPRLKRVIRWFMERILKHAGY